MQLTNPAEMPRFGVVLVGERVEVSQKAVSLGIEEANEKMNLLTFKL